MRDPDNMKTRLVAKRVVCNPSPKNSYKNPIRT